MASGDEWLGPTDAGDVEVLRWAVLLNDTAMGVMQLQQAELLDLRGTLHGLIRLLASQAVFPEAETVVKAAVDEWRARAAVEAALNGDALGRLRDQLAVLRAAIERRRPTMREDAVPEDASQTPQPDRN